MFQRVPLFMTTVMLAVLAQASYARLPFAVTVVLAVLAIIVGLLALAQQFQRWQAWRRGRTRTDEDKTM